MLRIDSSKIDLDVDKYEEILSNHSYIYIDEIKFRQELNSLSDLVSSNYSLALAIMNATSNNKFLAINDYAVKSFLETYYFVPPYKFNSNKNVRKFTVDCDKVLRPLLESGYAPDFLTTYIRHKSGKSISGVMKKLIDSSLVSPELEGNQNNTVRRVNSYVTREKNLRFYYHDKNLIGIPQTFNSCTCEQKGKLLCWGDFNQSDFRIAYNLFMKSEDNITTMLKYKDKYEAMARILYKKLDMEFNLDSFKKNRDKFKINILGPIYGKTSSTDEVSLKFIKMLNSYLDLCPRYVEFKNRVIKREKSGLPISLRGYFGNTEIIYRKYKSIDTINEALNSPIQLGTSQVVILVTLCIIEKFRELGYTEDDVDVYFVRHDEPIFTVSERAMKDSWIFKQCATLLVDDWSPLDLDFYFGYSYKEVDDGLMEQFTHSCIDNNDQIDIFDYVYDNTKIETYMPLESTCELGIFVEYLDDKFIASVTDIEGRGKCIIKSGLENNENSFQEVLNEVISSIVNSDYYKSLNSNCLIVYTNCKSGPNFIDGSFVSICNEGTSFYFDSRDLCLYTCYRYSQKYNVSYSNNLPREQVVKRANEIFLKGDTPYVC